MQVPVLAFAATAMPATMDGAGVLYETKDPVHVAALMDAIISNPGLQDAIVEGQAAAVDRLRSRDFAGTLLGFVDEILGGAAGAGAARHLRLLASVRRRAGARGAPVVPAVHLQSAPGGAVIVNQWVPAAHRGDAIGDSARRVRDLLRQLGHSSDLYALSIDDELTDDVRPFSDPDARRGDLTIFHYALPVADDRGVRVARLRTHPAVSQRDAGRVLRSLRCRTCSGWPRSAGASSPRWRDAWIWRSATRSTTGRSSSSSGSSPPASSPSPSTRAASPGASTGRRSKASWTTGS